MKTYTVYLRNGAEIRIEVKNRCDGWVYQLTQRHADTTPEGALWGAIRLLQLDAAEVYSDPSQSRFHRLKDRIADFVTVEDFDTINQEFPT